MLDANELHGHDNVLIITRTHEAAVTQRAVPKRWQARCNRAMSPSPLTNANAGSVNGQWSARMARTTLRPILQARRVPRPIKDTTVLAFVMAYLPWS